MDTDSYEKQEQIRRAQEMVLESYLDQLSGGKSFSTSEVRSAMNQIIEGENNAQNPTLE